MEPGPASLAKSLPVKNVNPTGSVEGTKASEASPNQNHLQNSSEKNASGDDKSNSGKMQICLEVVDENLTLKNENATLTININSNENKNSEAKINPKHKSEVELNNKICPSKINQLRINTNITNESKKIINKKRKKIVKPKIENNFPSNTNFSEDHDDSIEINLPPRKKARTKSNSNQKASCFAQILKPNIFIPKRKYRKNIKQRAKKVKRRKNVKKRSEKKKSIYYQKQRFRKKGRCEKHRKERFVTKLFILALYLRYLDARRCIHSSSVIQS